MEAEDTLRRVALFQDLQPKHITALARWASTRTYQPGQVIVAEGQPGLGLYFIQQGTVRVSQHTPEGEREIRTMGPGESFGELSLLDNEPRSASVTAVDWTTAVLLDKGQFLAELRTHPEIALQILPVLTRWLREAQATIAQLS